MFFISKETTLSSSPGGRVLSDNWTCFQHLLVDRSAKCTNNEAYSQHETMYTVIEYIGNRCDVRLTNWIITVCDKTNKI